MTPAAQPIARQAMDKICESCTNYLDDCHWDQCSGLYFEPNSEAPGVREGALARAGHTERGGVADEAVSSLGDNPTPQISPDQDSGT